MWKNEEDANAKITGIQLDNGEKIRGEQVLVATGGNSYPSTGSTGDGYRMAKEGGHTVTDLQPSLVPMVTAEEYITRLQGLSLKNVTLSLYDGKKCVYEDFGEMMFTHFGITGPLVLSASAKVGKLLKKKYLTARIDLKPALTAEQLDARLLREFEEGKNKQFKTWPVLYSRQNFFRLCWISAASHREKKCMRSPEKNVPDLSKRRKPSIYRDRTAGLPGGHHHKRRRSGKRSGSKDDGVQKDKRALFCRRSAGSGCTDRWL